MQLCMYPYAIMHVSLCNYACVHMQLRMCPYAIMYVSLLLSISTHCRLFLVSRSDVN